jgi:hypothetical protein
VAILAIVLALFAIGYYLVFVPIMGNRYHILFEMDEVGIRHVEMPSSVKRTELISLMGVLAGMAAGSPTAVGANLLAGSRKQMYTKFKDVRKIVVYGKKSVIKLISRDLTRNLIYTKPSNFEFIKRHILSHCSDAPVKG